MSDGLVGSRDFVVAGHELSVEAARREDLAVLNRVLCGALQERLELVLTDLALTIRASTPNSSSP